MSNGGKIAIAVVFTLIALVAIGVLIFFLCKKCNCNCGATFSKFGVAAAGIFKKRDKTPEEIKRDLEKQ